MEVKTTIVVYGKLNNLNDYTKACRANRYAGAKMKEDNENKIKAAVLSQIGFMKFSGKVRLNFTWIEENRKRDLDNICFAKKFILDALVDMQTIESDGWKGVEGFTDTFLVDKDRPRIEIEIEGTLKE